ncbi:unnamed protein product [Rotaria sp. Silwood2]|nr:unnamed protein product [Rotaria sp. Silwood2]CAF3024985.1 unnamed protein product [Rotaria sp. Silwood2]CAF3289863.1 unnamed protein product [Rotaria sp. Silwood2]CAF3326205.1 unnamed protein product [Rotaria sp. Silwood2]CAF4176533.1 unnamed protein product [Rotaria sp. Silwood2]
MIKTIVPRVSKLAIIPVGRESLLNAIIHFEKSNDQISNRCILSLKDICTRRLLLFVGDDHEIYNQYLSSQLVRYITYDYLTETNNNQYRLINNDELFSNSRLLVCRNCSLSNLGASKCRRRKCLANRVRQVLNQLSCQIIPWEKREQFLILENNDDDDDDDDNSIVFIYLKSNCSRHKSSQQRHEQNNDRSWIQKQLYLIDLLRILHINIARE